MKNDDFFGELKIRNDVKMYSLMQFASKITSHDKSVESTKVDQLLPYNRIKKQCVSNVCEKSNVDCPIFFLHEVLYWRFIMLYIN